MGQTLKSPRKKLDTPLTTGTYLALKKTRLGIWLKGTRFFSYLPRHRNKSGKIPEGECPWRKAFADFMVPKSPGLDLDFAWINTIPLFSPDAGRRWRAWKYKWTSSSKGIKKAFLLLITWIRSAGHHDPS